MGSLKSLTQGFLLAAALIWVFNIAALIRGGNDLLGLTYALILLIPISGITYLKLKNTNPRPAPEKSEKWRSLLFSFQGVAIAFWTFDIATTFYAINVTGLAVELNPLGWPLGILGAFAYYAPTLVFAYILLFKIKESVALYSTIPLTLLTLGMGAMNFMAGAQNFQVFVDTATLAAGIQYGLLSLIITVNLIVPFALKKIVSQSKAVLS